MWKDVFHWRQLKRSYKSILHFSAWCAYCNRIYIASNTDTGSLGIQLLCPITFMAECLVAKGQCKTLTTRILFSEGVVTLRRGEEFLHVLCVDGGGWRCTVLIVWSPDRSPSWIGQGAMRSPITSAWGALLCQWAVTFVPWTLGIGSCLSHRLRSVCIDTKVVATLLSCCWLCVSEGHFHVAFDLWYYSTLIWSCSSTQCFLLLFLHPAQTISNE